MVSTNSDQTPAPTRTEGDRRSRGARIRPWVNWTLALLTAPASVVVPQGGQFSAEGRSHRQRRGGKREVGGGPQGWQIRIL